MTLERTLRAMDTEMNIFGGQKSVSLFRLECVCVWHPGDSVTANAATFNCDL